MGQAIFSILEVWNLKSGGGKNVLKISSWLGVGKIEIWGNLRAAAPARGKNRLKTQKSISAVSLQKEENAQ